MLVTPAEGLRVRASLAFPAIILAILNKPSHARSREASHARNAVSTSPEREWRAGAVAGTSGATGEVGGQPPRPPARDRGSIGLYLKIRGAGGKAG